MVRAGLLILATLGLMAACGPSNQRFDFDGDGVEDSVDCAPEDATTFAGAPDPYGDDIDQDCDGSDGIDGDGDGWPSNVDPDDPDWDCNDANGQIHPGAAEIADDDVDQDCDEADLVCDADLDTVLGPQCDGPDCDDGDGSCATEADCADGDGDGFRVCDNDCDDAEAARYPGNPEVCDGLDNDCNAEVPTDERDQDLDGISECEGDCDDLRSDVHPTAIEVCDGVDTDCDDGTTTPGGEADADSDGEWACTDCDDDDSDAHHLDVDGDGSTSCGLDCDDDDPDIGPIAPDPFGDGVDGNCDGIDGIDADGDGAPQGVDCDDADASLNTDDLDGDGASTCGGDCDDSDDTLNVDDADFDGFDTCTGDCDDTAYAVNPAAAEVCDFVDNDCDGVQTDEVDGDGDGDPLCSDCDDGDDTLDSVDGDGDTFSLCTNDCDDTSILFNPIALDPVGDGYDTNCDDLDGVDLDGDQFASVASGGADCDDGDDSIYPGAEDLPNDGIDSDCDGLDLPDADGDGYGDEDEGGEDCDDGDASIHPGFFEESGDLVDSNCDGPDGNVVWSFVGGVDDYTAQFLGSQAVCDIDGDGQDDLAVGSAQWGATPTSMGSGVVHVFYGPLVTGFSLSAADATLAGPGDQTGYAVACAGDPDGDGDEDLLISDPWEEPDWLGPNPAVGVTWVVSGTLTGAVALDASFTRIGSSQTGASGVGAWVGPAGDLDDDGFDDFVIVDTDLWANGFSIAYALGEGTAHILYGPIIGDVDLLTVADANYTTNWEFSYLTPTAPAGDLNGDGRDDLLVSETDTSTGQSVTAVLMGPVLGNLTSASGQARLNGASNSYGSWVGESAGDINGDGTNDVAVVSWHSALLPGYVHIFYGPLLGDIDLAFADAVISAGAGDTLQPNSVAPIGDVDGDGQDDLLVGGWLLEDGPLVTLDPDHSVIAVFYGPLSGALDLATADVEFVETIDLSGSDAFHHFLFAARGGDLDGDGDPDPVYAHHPANNGSLTVPGAIRVAPNPYP